jgi:Fic family protein
MGRRPYRVESVIPTKGKAKHFLVKESQIEGQRVKVRKYLRSGNVLSVKELEEYRREYAFDLELKAAKEFSEEITIKYKTRHLNIDQIKNIEIIRFLYKSFRDSLTKQELIAYEQDFEINYIQGTTSIEGNTFSIKDTKELIIHDNPPKDKTLREINEIQNFKNVRIFREKYKGKVDLEFIKTLHAIIMHNIDNESAGFFRRTDRIGITGYDLQLCPADEIQNELSKILVFYHDQIKHNFHPFEEAAMFHYFFETIHPFTDGNGRVGREILNFMLMKYKYPRLIFPQRDRDQYLNALKLGNDEKYSEMVSFFTDIIIEQNLNFLQDVMKKLIELPTKTGQMRLSEFF